MAQITAAPRRRNHAIRILAVVGAGMLVVLPLVLNLLPTGSSTAGIAADTPRIAYFEFGPRADTLWLANPAEPDDRRQLQVIAHAPDYGLIPALSSNSRAAAYTVLPPETPAPGPDSPAQLWHLSLENGETRLLAEGADLLVPAVWSSDDGSIVFRRSSGVTTSLYAINTDGANERLLVQADTALFPVAFSPDSSLLYYVQLTEQSSQLYQLAAAGGEPVLLSQLAGGLTRDWALSPDGDRLAFLEMTFDGQLTAARARVLRISTGETTPVGQPDTDAFNPTWTKDGQLILGQLQPGSNVGAAAMMSGDNHASLTSPLRGFDVPLASNSSAGTAVTSFSGTSIVNPGRATLVVVDPAGVRREIASGEVTFLGWITP